MSDTIQVLTDGPAGQWWNEYAAGLENATDCHITVFFRTLTPASGAHGQRTEVLELLSAIRKRDIIDSYDVRILGGEVCLCATCQGTDPARQTLETVTELASWRDGSVTSTGFTEREVDCSITGDQYRTLVPPETAVGTYLDDSLAGVFPCVSDGLHYSVMSFFQSLLDETAETKPNPELSRVR